MKSKILIILLLIFVFISSCARETGSCKITKAQEQIIPYEKGKVICFTDSIGESVYLTVIESKVIEYHESDGNLRNNYFTLKNKEVLLKSDTNNIEINLSAERYCWSDDYQGQFGVDIEQDTLNFYFQIDLDGNFLNYSEGYTFNYFHDSLKINNKVYYDVIEQKNDYSNYEGSIYISRLPIQLFYNKKVGILQIKRNGKDYLTLNDKNF